MKFNKESFEKAIEVNEITKYHRYFEQVVKSYLEIESQKLRENESEMFLNMQYYMEYCEKNGYVTPIDWIEKHKHF